MSLPYELLVQIYFGIVASSLAVGHIFATLTNVRRLYTFLNPPPTAPVMTEMSLLNDPHYNSCGVDDTASLEGDDELRGHDLEGRDRDKRDEAGGCCESERVDGGADPGGGDPYSPESSEVQAERRGGLGSEV